jgi:hypothetical protein
MKAAPNKCLGNFEDMYKGRITEQAAPTNTLNVVRVPGKL